MCGVGGGGGGPSGQDSYGSVNYGADVAAGRGDIGGGWSDSADGMPGTTPGEAEAGGYNGPLGSPSGTGSTRGDLAASTTFADYMGMTAQEAQELSDSVAPIVVGLFGALPGMGRGVSAMVSEARGAGQEPGIIGSSLGDTGPGGTGGPGADPSRLPSGYLGPSGAPRTATTPSGTTYGPNIIPPTIVQTGPQYATERGKTPAEIDAANKLRLSREQAYAAQKTNAESELLKALSLRDVTSGTPESRLTESAPAAVRFTGLPPTLGQSRHRWA